MEVTVKIKDINDSVIEVTSVEIYEGLGKVLGLRRPDPKSIYWADNDNWVYELTEYGFKKVLTAH